MRTRSLLPVLLLSILPLAGCAGSADAARADDDRVATSVTATDDVPEPAHGCREVDGADICDTFDEGTEGPGTDRVPPAPEASTAPDAATAPNAVTAPDPTAPGAVRDTAAEVGHAEGPGTGTLPGTGRDCRELGGRQVCDTFGEGDEGPGTYDDRDEGPGTTG